MLPRQGGFRETRTPGVTRVTFGNQRRIFEEACIKMGAQLFSIASVAECAEISRGACLVRRLNGVPGREITVKVKFRPGNMQSRQTDVVGYGDAKRRSDVHSGQQQHVRLLVVTNGRGLGIRPASEEVSSQYAQCPAARDGAVL